MAYCTACGTAASGKFCSECGTALIQTIAAGAAPRADAGTAERATAPPRRRRRPPRWVARAATAGALGTAAVLAGTGGGLPTLGWDAALPGLQDADRHLPVIGHFAADGCGGVGDAQELPERMRLLVTNQTMPCPLGPGGDHAGLSNGTEVRVRDADGTRAGRRSADRRHP